MELLTPRESVATYTGLEGVEAFFFFVTPVVAERLLEGYSVDYRKLLPNHMESIARDMDNDRFRFNGAPILIGEDDELLDGQHRLRAVVKTGKGQIFLVVTGIPHAAYDVTDAGRSRRFKDILRRLDYGNVDVLASLIRMIYMWENGASLGDTSVITHQELIEVLERNKKTIQRAMQVGSNARRLKMAPSLTVFAWWIFMQIDEEKAFTFMTQAIEGEMIKKGMPSFTLRDRLLREWESGVQLHRNQYFRMAVDAWNAEYLGNGIDRIYIQSTTAPVKPEYIEGYVEAMKEKNDGVA